MEVRSCCTKKAPGPFEKKAVANREKQIKKWTREKRLQLMSKGTGKLK